MAMLLFVIFNYFKLTPQEQPEKVNCTVSGCHADYLKLKVVHPVIKDDCETCHFKNSNKHPDGVGKEYSLPKNVPELCYDCHDLSIKNQKSEHVPFKDGECLTCHDPHGSNQKFLLNTNDGKIICTSCHTDLDNEKYVHGPVQKLECLACHSPHNSIHSKLKKQEEPELCLKCHNKSIKSGENEFEAIKPKLNRKYVHPPAMYGCNECHKPHSSKNNFLLTSEFHEGNYVPGKAESFALCFKCHDQNLLTMKNTENATNFRNGNTNLHFLHIGNEKGRNCTLCHDIHGANKEHLIKDVAKLGSWTMNLNYIKSENGGSCAPGCHKPLDYDKTLPVIAGKSDIESPIKVTDKAKEVKGSVSGKLILGGGIDKKLIVGMNIHFMNRDSSFKDITTVQKDLSFSMKNLKAGEYIAWIEQGDLDDIDLVSTESLNKFIINENEDANNKNNINFELRKVVIVKQGAEKPSVKLKVKPDETRLLTYTDENNVIENRNIKNYLNSKLIYLKSHKNSKLIIIAHTDDLGTLVELQAKSENVAREVEKFFISKGIAKFRLLTMGKGSLEPVANNNTSEGRAKNRRIEMKIIQ
ncbi:MAG: cytochrome c3 family protein [Bacteroidetes bacterium]|nr:cytochrome c3 family protein [Bacteroidota bacterium]